MVALIIVLNTLTYFSAPAPMPSPPSSKLRPLAPASKPPAPCRDRFLEPFSSDSIWNVAIGSKAVFAPANLYSTPDLYPSSFHNDQDFIVRLSPEGNDTVELKWINQGDWGADDHCAVQNHRHSGLACSDASTALDGCATPILLPQGWTSASDCDSDSTNCLSRANQSNNNAMAILMPDNETLVQMQPAYRCGTGIDSPFFARWGNHTDGGPQNFPNVTSIFGDGILGAHGGSGLSSIGGSIRLGELLPDAPAIPHALKIELNNGWYYGLKALNPSTEGNGGRTNYVWPAIGSNAGMNPHLGNGSVPCWPHRCHEPECECSGYTGINPFVAPGALLAIPASQAKSVITTTVIGAKIKQALVDYGAYLVDGSGGSQHYQRDRHFNLAAICMDAKVNAEMRRVYGFAMTYPDGVSINNTVGINKGEEGAKLYHDLLHCFQALHAVTNNAPDNVGGGGVPRVPRKPPICGAI